ncbi:NAD(P)H-dependent glycerol-3-phosphate dehydrogenase [Sphingorhabdus arenilitoris]|uniref:Glycerol-3-phosphate dehydrogenase [NAD(P)+] n=1 Tax=Sphingorhabdus arenilitoris TaxID=1490041 RepID=A0ABV8RKT9_9SPHN
MSSYDYPVGIVGAGAWGTALAAVMADIHGKALLWARDPSLVAAINAAHENADYLPAIPLPASIMASNDMDDLARCAILLIVTPAQHLRHFLTNMPDIRSPLLLCCKGIEAGTGALMVDIAREVRPVNPVAILSGPTFAHEVAARKPAAMTLACEHEALGEQLAQAVAAPYFRPYWTDDVIGAEIGGAVKNVLAIGCGVVDGAGLGLNARASLIARGFAEMQRYGIARGARPETLAGLSGLGDLVLTCSSENSRNFSLGKGLGQGQSAADLLNGRRTVAEGAATAPVLLASAQALGADMPIVAAVCRLLDGSADVNEVIKALLSRPLKAER